MIDQNEIIGLIAAVCTTFDFFPSGHEGLENQTNQGFVITYVFYHVYRHNPMVSLRNSNR